MFSFLYVLWTTSDFFFLKKKKKKKTKQKKTLINGKILIIEVEAGSVLIYIIYQLFINLYLDILYISTNWREDKRLHILGKVETRLNDKYWVKTKT